MDKTLRSLAAAYIAEDESVEPSKVWLNTLGRKMADTINADQPVPNGSNMVNNLQKPDHKDRLIEQLEETVIWQAKRIAELLEEPQEPRPCHVFNVTKNGTLTEWEPTTMAFALPDGKHALYTAPQPRRQVELTDEDIMDALLRIDPEAQRLPPGLRNFARSVIEAYKEENT